LEAQEQFGEMGVFEPLCALSYTLGMQGKYVEALQKVSDASTKYCALTKEVYYLRSLVFEAFILIQQGKWIEARKIMERVWAKQNGDFALRFYEKPEWYGSIYQNNKEWDQAERHYRLFLDINNYPANRYYHRCSAYLGLIQVKHAQGNIAAIPTLSTEAEQLAQQYEYNDHLASLRLIQGHLALEAGKENEAISFYQKAIIYALRYNRFLLDDLLSGRTQGAALQPIIPYCLEYGEQGRKILSTLRDWWKIGVNDVGTSRPDTISFIPEGIPLLEAEKIAREHEVGDGSMQKDVIGQFEIIQYSEN
jgi:tetratricopeptide (TPR) repeat protein